jgi:hypothetical protein
VVVFNVVFVAIVVMIAVSNQFCFWVKNHRSGRFSCVTCESDESINAILSCLLVVFPLLRVTCVPLCSTM